ncbi:hypothetical protein ABZP36_016181 [Zizania latifolia]
MASSRILHVWLTTRSGIFGGTPSVSRSLGSAMAICLFSVHNLLLRECAKSSSDVSARLAVTRLVQEARGLDAGPRLVQKFLGFGDHRSADIVTKVAEELAHVSVGLHWFLKVCQMMGREYDVVLNGFHLNTQIVMKLVYPENGKVVTQLWYDEKFKHEMSSSGVRN